MKNKHNLFQKNIIKGLFDTVITQMQPDTPVI